MSTLHPSPLGGRRPRKDELSSFENARISDRLPSLENPYSVRLLIVGINPGLWTAAVNAPFSHPGNRFWPSLDRASIVSPVIDASAGMSDSDEERLQKLGIGITNLVPRATARADQLGKAELRSSLPRLLRIVEATAPEAVAVVGITAYRIAFDRRHAQLGKQDTDQIPGWPRVSSLWVLPQPSGLNAHETIDSLADKWRTLWADMNAHSSPEPSGPGELPHDL